LNSSVVVIATVVAISAVDAISAALSYQVISFVLTSKPTAVVTTTATITTIATTTTTTIIKFHSFKYSNSCYFVSTNTIILSFPNF